MKFTQFWPLAFIGLIPIIILMYMLKQKAKDQKVASLFLWQEMARNDRANTPWEKLKKNWLMILQIITLLVLILALMSPYFMSGLVSSKETCIIIDTSASMNTMYDEDQTRFDKAKEEALNYVRKLRYGTKVSVVTSDKSATLITNKLQNKSDVTDMIKDLQATTYAGDAYEGVKMVKSLTTETKGVDTLILTDTDVDCENLNATVVDVYSPKDNVLIDYVSHGYKDGKLDILVKVTNKSAKEQKRDISIYQEDKLVSNQEVDLEAQSSKIIYFEDVILDGNIYFAQVSGKDALEYDNICYDVLAEENEKSVLLMTKANVYLEKALNLIPGISVTKSEDIDNFSEFSKQEFDLYIFDSMVPQTLPSQGSIIIFGSECEQIASTKDYLDDGRIISPNESQTTKYLDGMSFGVSKTYAYNIPEYAHSFLETNGVDQGEKVSVGFIGENNGRTYAMLGFDLHNSDLPLYMEFPVLMYNLVNECINSGIISNFVYESGNSVSLNANVNGDLPSIVKPSGALIGLSDFRYSFNNTDELGVYLVSQKINGKEENSHFVVNFPRSESKIDTYPSMLVSEDENVVSEVKGIFNLRNFIIILALLLLAVEWIASIRR